MNPALRGNYISMKVASKRHCDKCSAILSKCFQITHTESLVKRKRRSYNQKHKGDLLNCYSMKMCQLFYFMKPLVIKQDGGKLSFFFNQMLDGICKTFEEK